MNQEFPVGASHKLASITSLPFVHTARRYYRLSVLVRSSDCRVIVASPLLPRREDDQTVALRGSKSRNKVSVGEPAEGSLQVFSLHRETFVDTSPEPSFLDGGLQALSPLSGRHERCPSRLGVLPCRV